MDTKPSNPNGANQFFLDPRQKLCWGYYINPKEAETFGNAFQSAIKAGYEDSYARTITDSEWFRDKVRRLNLFIKGERVLEEMLDMPIEKTLILDGEEDEDGEPGEQTIVKKIDPALAKVKQDTAKFVVERLGKNEGYSTRTEHSGVDGKDLEIKEIKYITPEAPKPDGSDTSTDV